MRKSLLITALFVAATAIANAQYKAIEIKQNKNTNGLTLSNGKIAEPDGIHEFTIRANEEADVNLNFSVTQGDLNVVVRSKNDKVVYAKKFDQKDNRMAFTMDRDQEYTVRLSASPNTKYSVNVNENQ
jgi:hypothetical protein